MSRDPRVAIAAAAHAAVMVAAITIVAAAHWPWPVKIVFMALIVAVLFPGLRSLLTGRSEHFARIGLLLVLVIGVGLVEVLASGGGLHASFLLGAAMLEFAVLFSLTRPGRRQGPRAPKRS